MVYLMNIRPHRCIRIDWGLFLMALTTLAACSPSPPAALPDFPQQLVSKLIDAPTGQAADLILKEPGVRSIPGALRRFEWPPGSALEEIIIFSSVRSDRVETVILKYRAKLPPERRQALLGPLGLPPELSGAQNAQTHWKGRTLRALGADKNGRLTLTLEGPVSAASPQSNAPTGR